ncbi:DUF1482 family protein [Klebsiella quasipneumoniae subsp. similipneumoniae]
MNTLFALVISVCALTGECSDVLIGVYPSEASCNSKADEQKVQGQCLPTEIHKTWLTTNSLQ